MSRSRDRVGFSAAQWKGAMKMPNLMRAGRVTALSFPSGSGASASMLFGGSVVNWAYSLGGGGIRRGFYSVVGAGF